MWLQRKMREFNFIRFGATMQVSVIPDLGAAAVDLNQFLASRRAPAGLDTSRREASLRHYLGRVRVAPFAAGSRSI